MNILLLFTWVNYVNDLKTSTKTSTISSSYYHQFESPYKQNLHSIKDQCTHPQPLIFAAIIICTDFFVLFPPMPFNSFNAWAISVRSNLKQSPTFSCSIALASKQKFVDTKSLREELHINKKGENRKVFSFSILAQLLKCNHRVKHYWALTRIYIAIILFSCVWKEKFPKEKKCASFQRM